MTAAPLHPLFLPCVVSVTGIGVAAGTRAAVAAAAVIIAVLASVERTPPHRHHRRRHLALVDGRILETCPLAHRPMGTQD